MALSLLVGISLGIFAFTLVVAGRRRSEGVALAIFLALVAVNFLAGGIATLTGVVAWRMVEFAALALDPLFLLLFVTGYPYRRRMRPATALIALAAVGAVVGVVLVGLDMERFFLLPPARGLSLAVFILAASYAGAWFLALAAAAGSPTPALGRRSAWLVAALGAAVLPRLAVLPRDFWWWWAPQMREWKVAILGDPSPSSTATWFWLDAAIQLGSALLIVGALAAVSFGFVVSLRRSLPTAVAGARRFAFAVALGLLGLSAAIDILATLTPMEFGGANPFALRWLVFGAILLYGILSHEIAEFSVAVDRVFPVAGGTIGAATGFLITAVYVGRAVETPAVMWALAIAVALAVAVPAGALVRLLCRTMGPGGVGGEGDARRLGLYRAALEAAYVSGPPSAATRRQLERDRRGFGVSIQEARGVEHPVAAAAQATTAGLAAGSEPSPGLVVDRMLGEGTHGRVFEGRLFPEGKRVVVKEFRSTRHGDDVSSARLLHEMRAVRDLDHPNIVRLLDLRMDGARPLLVMEHVDGKPLSELLAEGRVPEARVAAILHDVLGGLQEAHRHGIVHRDVKPSNIIVAKDSRAYLTDFGVAAVRGEEGVPRSTVASFDGVGAVTGSLAYMAPEQALGTTVGPQADLFAAGLVAYEALTGHPARDLRGCSLYEALEQIAQANIDVADVPTRWRGFVTKALKTDLQERFASAADMLDKVPAAARAGGRREKSGSSATAAPA